MLMPVAWTLLYSPVLLAGLAFDRSLWPEATDAWEPIGLFKLRDDDADRLVLLYYRDSDSVAERKIARNGFAMQMYPNSFDVHAIYQDASGNWVHKQIFGYARVRFKQVARVAPDYLDLECRGNFRIYLDGTAGADALLKRAAEINKPFSKRIAFISGVLTAK